ncbi:MAG: 50S ribosomal protein L34e [Thermoproteota archaeon]|nr:MAG: 50S ribosomal protein L34e [Candidatus Korarchaeota archaeon]RLG54514.1 MAG: 50S ribosomal protein L34e [Candidatus Korarchaeota archaeon]
MPAPRYRSRSLKRRFIRTPGGRTVVHYKKKRHSYAKCAVCKGRLNAVPTGPRVEIRKLPKSMRRPNRPYGGYLCPKCLREKIKSEVISEGLHILEIQS